VDDENEGEEQTRLPCMEPEPNVSPHSQLLLQLHTHTSHSRFDAPRSEVAQVLQGEAGGRLNRLRSPSSNRCLSRTAPRLPWAYQTRQAYSKLHVLVLHARQSIPSADMTGLWATKQQRCLWYAIDQGRHAAMRFGVMQEAADSGRG